MTRFCMYCGKPMELEDKTAPWQTFLKCWHCLATLVISHGDAMGGSFDHLKWERGKK